jgi:hypothetical protein
MFPPHATSPSADEDPRASSCPKSGAGWGQSLWDSGACSGAEADMSINFEKLFFFGDSITDPGGCRSLSAPIRPMWVDASPTAKFMPRS